MNPKPPLPPMSVEEQQEILDEMKRRAYGFPTEEEARRKGREASQKERGWRRSVDKRHKASKAARKARRKNR